MKPLLRYPGGKSKLAVQIADLLGNCQTYVEPFLGSGAVFLEMHRRGAYRNALLADSNRDLIRMYRMVRDQPHAVIEAFKEWPQDEQTYYRVRDAAQEFTSVQLAARELYLNRLCFNGLYRKNLKGNFNVPWGHFKKHRPLDEGNLLRVSHALENTTLLDVAFSDVINMAGDGASLYCDPPYHGGFTQYTGTFDWNDQNRLHDDLCLAHERGVKVVASNSWEPEIVELYRSTGKFKVRQISVSRSISCRGDGRQPAMEMLAVTTS